MQSDPQERRSSWDPNESLVSSGSLVSNERTGHHKEPRTSRREMLHDLADQYHAEKRRADDAERMLQELTVRLNAINDARLQALHDATKANEELKLYKIQLNSAQNEIYRAQDIIEVVDRQRYNAEKEAAKLRSKARQLNEIIVMSAAREEAWKLGLQEGLNRGRDQSNEENRFTEDYAEEPEEDALDVDDDSFDESLSSNDANTFPRRPPSGTHSSHFPVPVQLPSNPPMVAHSVHPSENNIRPMSIRSGYTRPSSRQRAAPSPSPTPVPLPANPPTSSQSIHPSENVRPMSIRSGYTRPPSRQRAASSPTPVLIPANPPTSSQSIHPSENVRPMSIRSGYTRPSSRQRLSPSPVPAPSNTRPSSQYENIQPANIHSTTPRHIPSVIPPDNFIPSLDADNKIRIPPPFQFQRAVMTPERPVSPQLPAMSDSSQEALIVPGRHAKAPPRQHRKRYHRRHSSSESNSSSLSNLDIINDHPPIGIGTPMSIIPEVFSVHSIASQLPDGDHHPRYQRSFSENSTHTNLDNSQAQTHLRPHSRSSYAGSTRNASWQAENRVNSHASSPPEISVQPPSRPISMGQWGGSSKATPSLSHNVTLPPVLETHGSSSTSVQGRHHSAVDPKFSPTHSGRNVNNYATNDDDVISSGMGTDPLMTPPAKERESIQPDWSGASASAGHVPLLPSDSLTGPVPWGLNSLNIDAIMGSGRKKGKGK